LDTDGGEIDLGLDALNDKELADLERIRSSSRIARDVLSNSLDWISGMHEWCDQHGRHDTGLISISHETVDRIEGDMATAIATLSFGIGDSGSPDGGESHGE
jgi:hypothetical protein